MAPGNPKYRFLYAIWGFLECLGFGGLIYGWGSLVFILKDEGIYADLCEVPSNMSSLVTNASSTVAYETNTSLTDANQSLIITDDSLTTVATDAEKMSILNGNCKERNDRFTLVFTIGSAMFCVGCFIIGQINFKFGTRVTRLTALAVLIVGLFCIAFTSKESPWLVFPGLSLLGAGGITFLMTNTQIAILFPSMGSAIVGLMCGGFDASSGIMLMVKIGYENGISRQTSFLILAGASVLTLVSTFFFLPKDFIKKPPVKQLHGESGDEAAVELTNDKLKEDKSAEAEKDATIPSLGSCMMSPVYILHVLWLAILQLRFYYLLGSINPMMEDLLHSKDEVSHFTNVLMYILMCGLVAAPLAGYIYDFHNRFFMNSQSPLRRMLMPAVIPLALTTTLCILMSAVLLVRDPDALYIVFFILLFFRAFLYTMGAGYLGAIFPSQYFGIMYGVLIITGGIISMFQYALFQWSESQGYTQVNLFLLVLTFTTFGHPLFQWWKCRRAENSFVVQE